jgi:hypothetical protein
MAIAIATPTTLSKFNSKLPSFLRNQLFSAGSIASTDSSESSKSTGSIDATESSGSNGSNSNVKKRAKEQPSRYRRLRPWQDQRGIDSGIGSLNSNQSLKLEQDHKHNIDPKKKTEIKKPHEKRFKKRDMVWVSNANDGHEGFAEEEISQERTELLFPLKDGRQDKRFKRDSDQPLTSAERDFFRKKYKANSIYKRVKKEVLDTFLRSPVPRNRDVAIDLFRKRNPDNFLIFELLFHKLNAKQIRTIWRQAQKSPKWLRNRFGCRTGTEGGYLLNWNPYKNAVKYAYIKFWDSFMGNQATDHGSRTEKFSVKVYVNMVQQYLNLWYVQQESYRTGLFNFRGFIIQLKKNNPTDQYYAPPVIKAWHIGSVTDPFNHENRVSVDLLATINDIPLICGEAKIPWAAEFFLLYPIEPMYYVPQPLEGIRILKRLFPTIFIADRLTFSHLYGMTIDSFIIDPHWYNEWFIPRALRYHYGPQMEMMCEYVRQLFQFKYPNQSMTKEALTKFLSIEFFVPRCDSSADDLSLHDVSPISAVNSGQKNNSENLKKSNSLSDARRSNDSKETVPETENEAEEHRIATFLSEAEKFTPSKFCLFPHPQVISKSPNVYFSQQRQILWRAKCLSMDTILRHKLHSPNIPSFHTLLRYNRGQPIWQDDAAHFGRTAPFDGKKERKMLLPTQQNYIDLFQENKTQTVKEHLECELDMMTDFYWCVFVAGMQVDTPKHKSNHYFTSSLHESEQSRLANQHSFTQDIITLPAMCMNSKFAASSL